MTKKIKRTKTKPKIKRIWVKMKNKIYNKFQLEDKIETNQNLRIVKLTGIKNKLEIKRIKARMKNNTCDQFQMNNKIETNQNFYKKTQDKKEIKRPMTEKKNL